MASNAKIVLRKRSNKFGLYPLAIRITKNRRSTYQYVGHYIELEDWDKKNIRVKKSHPNSDSLNSLLSQKLSEANKALISSTLNLLIRNIAATLIIIINNLHHFH